MLKKLKNKWLCFPRKKLFIFGFLILILGISSASASCVFFDCKAKIYSLIVDDFDECVNYGFPVVASNPPRCYLSEDQIFIRDPKHIRVFQPKENANVNSPLLVKGEARALNNKVGYQLKSQSGSMLTEGVVRVNSSEHGRWGDFEALLEFETSAMTGILDVFDITPDNERINVISVPVNFSEEDIASVLEDQSESEFSADEEVSNSQKELDEANPEDAQIDNTNKDFPENDPLSKLSDENNPPRKVNLKVPFTSQAPYADWSPPYDEACEEASVIMVNSYLEGEDLSQEKANTGIILMTSWLEDHGYKVDVGTDELKEIVEAYFDNKKAYVYKNEDVTILNIKRLINAGHPVIVPAAGRLLENPNFRGAGPPYHMLVIVGYDDKRFFTNDPGTSRGDGFSYSHENLMNSIHDWTGDKSTIQSGEKAMMLITE